MSYWFFYGFITLALAGLIAFICGMWLVRPLMRVQHTRDQLIPSASQSRLAPTKLTKIAARSQGVTAGYSESLAVRDLIRGLRTRNPAVIRFALRGGGLLVFVLSAFLAIGTGIMVYDPADAGGGWLFIGFIVLWILVMVYRAATAPAENAKP